MKTNIPDSQSTIPMEILNDNTKKSEVCIIELNGNFPNYEYKEDEPFELLQKRLSEAFQANKLISLKCKLDNAQYQLHLFTTDTNKWVFTGACGLSAIDQPLHIISIALTADKIYAQDSYFNPETYNKSSN